jgi:hypothetical protein
LDDDGDALITEEEDPGNGGPVDDDENGDGTPDWTDDGGTDTDGDGVPDITDLDDNDGLWILRKTPILMVMIIL